jgi:Glycosyl hydrolases family 38 N-terminal domain
VSAPAAPDSKPSPRQNHSGSSLTNGRVDRSHRQRWCTVTSHGIALSWATLLFLSFLVALFVPLYYDFGVNKAKPRIGNKTPLIRISSSGNDTANAGKEQQRSLELQPQPHSTTRQKQSVQGAAQSEKSASPPLIRPKTITEKGLQGVVKPDASAASPTVPSPSPVDAKTVTYKGISQSQAMSRPTAASSKGQQGPDFIDMRVLNYELPFDNGNGGAWKQGWDVQPSKSARLQVFVVPHSHCNHFGFTDQIPYILATVMNALLQDERRKFIWAEMSFFASWWGNQGEDMRKNVRRLLQNRQLELVTGGWVQADEATTDLYALEIQLQEGHDWIRSHLGAEFLPRAGWSVDAYGHSSAAAYLWKKYNFTAMLIHRVHYAVKKELAQ